MRHVLQLILIRLKRGIYHISGEKNNVELEQLTVTKKCIKMDELSNQCRISKMQ